MCSRETGKVEDVGEVGKHMYQLPNCMHPVWAADPRGGVLLHGSCSRLDKKQIVDGSTHSWEQGGTQAG